MRKTADLYYNVSVALAILEIGTTVWLVCLFDSLTSLSATRLYRGRVPRLAILRAATHETERGGHGLSLSRSHQQYGGSLIS